MDRFLILPHQLFDKKYLPKNFKYTIWEHPQYFTKYNFNQKKLILHRASMKSYYEYLQKNKFNVEYFEFSQLPKLTKYSLFDPIDKLELKGKYTLFESPNFLISKEVHEEYREKTQNFIFHNFYMWNKKKLDIIPKLKSQDKDNREKLPNDEDIPDLLKVKSPFINEAIKYVKKNFSSNYGNTKDFNFPINHSQARKWLKDFLQNKFKKFGVYEDAIHTDEDYIYHSILSTSINIGLLNPLEIITEVEKYKKTVPINSYEGYIRQLFWREYQRYCYIYFDFENKDYFKNKKSLTKKWYNGSLGIDPVDDCIKKGFKNGYLHHIERLMIIGNYMNISEIKPMDGFRWFMEFSCDSYEWVMYQNVLEMVFCISGGVTMRKPYISSSKYILKMSNYKRGDWNKIWDQKYKDYLIKHKVKLLRDFKYFFHFIKKY
jgi:deoxyribodipyrimidine photolyase-related protein